MLRIRLYTRPQCPTELGIVALLHALTKAYHKDSINMQVPRYSVQPCALV